MPKLYDKATDFICLQIEKISSNELKILLRHKIKQLADHEHAYKQK